MRERILEALREDWKTPGEISLETGIPLEEVERVLEVLEDEGLVFRDGPLYLHRLGRR